MRSEQEPLVNGADNYEAGRRNWCREDGPQTLWSWRSPARSCWRVRSWREPADGHSDVHPKPESTRVRRAAGAGRET